MSIDIDIVAMRMRTSIAKALVAAGGLDKNRGNAEQLRRYWTRGKGAAKIRWGQPGDWSRCVSHLSKYMGARAKGYCQLRHKEALGFYTSTHAKKDRENSSLSELELLKLELSEALFGNLDSFATEVTDEDMAKDIDVIVSEVEEPEWYPDTEIIVLLEDAENHKEDDEYASPVFAAVDPAAIADLSPEEVKAIEEEAKAQEAGPTDAPVDAGRDKYTPETQPRDERGKFRQVLARLKTDLGASGLQDVVEKVQNAENLDNAGNYDSADKAAAELMGILDRLDAKALNPEALENIRLSAGELGKVISNLPFAFGQDAEKIRFSDIPPALKKLMKDMITRVEDKIGTEDADVATSELKTFISGSELYSQSEISSQMSKLLRLLT